VAPIASVFGLFLYRRQITQYMPDSLTSPFVTRNWTLIVHSATVVMLKMEELSAWEMPFVLNASANEIFV
jgi:hypothetical protein